MATDLDTGIKLIELWKLQACLADGTLVGLKKDLESATFDAIWMYPRNIANSKLAKRPYTDEMVRIMINAGAGRLAVLNRSLRRHWVKMALTQARVMVCDIVLAFELRGVEWDVRGRECADVSKE